MKTTNAQRPIKHLHFSEPSDCLWTGRNGSFDCVGLELMQYENKIVLSPIGKRGVGNCMIQFPVEKVAKVVAWLNNLNESKKQ